MSITSASAAAPSIQRLAILVVIVLGFCTLHILDSLLPNGAMSARTSHSTSSEVVQAGSNRPVDARAAASSAPDLSEAHPCSQPASSPETCLASRGVDTPIVPMFASTREQVSIVVQLYPAAVTLPGQISRTPTLEELSINRT